MSQARINLRLSGGGRKCKILQYYNSTCCAVLLFACLSAFLALLVCHEPVRSNKQDPFLVLFFFNFFFNFFLVLFFFLLFFVHSLPGQTFWGFNPISIDSCATNSAGLDDHQRMEQPNAGAVFAIRLEGITGIPEPFFRG